MIKRLSFQSTKHQLFLCPAYRVDTLFSVCLVSYLWILSFWNMLSISLTLYRFEVKYLAETQIELNLVEPHLPIDYNCPPNILAQSLRTLQWRLNGGDSVSNHQPHDCLLNRLFRRRSKKTSKLRVIGFVLGIHRGPVNSPHKWPVTRKMFPFDDVIMNISQSMVVILLCCLKFQSKDQMTGLFGGMGFQQIWFDDNFRSHTSWSALDGAKIEAVRLYVILAVLL